MPAIVQASPASRRMPLTGSSVPPAFADAVLEAYTAKTGRLTINSVEYGVLKSWYRRGVPLFVIENCIKESKTVPGSLSYYGPAVTEAHERRMCLTQTLAGQKNASEGIPDVSRPSVEELARVKAEIYARVGRDFGKDSA